MYGLITGGLVGGLIKVFLNNPKKFIEDFVVGFVESFIFGLGAVLIGILYEKLRHKG
jgi:ABC-type Mn2+/Zn2+ transport system permease subunit